ncbi:MAG TPA: flagellar filament capping protein FliD [Thauera sp.]|nr:flagellar filament capping protein FliD [Thauera sp.]
MATITSGGSIIDINSIVRGLMSVESRPLTLLAQREASQQAKLSAFGQIKGALSSLQTATDGLKTATKFSATKASVAGDAGFTASSGAGAANASYAVDVLQMAKIQRVSTPVGGSFTPAAGKLTIEFGTVTDAGSGKSFTSDSPPRTASLDFEGSTLEELRDAINGNAALGVKANIINNGTAKQLVLGGTATGANMAFKLTGEDGLEDLSFDPAATPLPADKMYSVQAAQDARIRVDGIEVTRGKNTITDVIDNVTLTLTKEPVAPAASLSGTLSVSEDQSAAKTAVEAFVKAYNDVASTLASLTAYNPDNKTGATLTGDSTARNIQSQLRNALGASITGLTGANSLSQVGISFDKDGKLALDSTKFTAALNDTSKDVAAFFTGKDGVKGFASSFSAQLDGLIARDGLINSRTEGINSTIKSLTTQYDTMEARLAKMEERYRKQYSTLDTLLNGLTQTSTYLMQQLANLPSIGRS